MHNFFKRNFLKLTFLFFIISFPSYVFSQSKDLEFHLDTNAKTTDLPAVFSPNIDLSGRGYHADVSWPYHLAYKEVISRWQSEIGFSKGLFRLYFNLWEIESVKNDPPLKKAIMDNYEKVIKSISDARGTVILVLYGTPPGWGDVLDKRSFPSNLKQWQNIVRQIIYYFSCQKQYRIWYELWSAPDSENFFLGTKKDYLSLYEATAKVIKELEIKNRISIPLGGPGVSSWFQNFGGNSILQPERSLIYELIKFCSQKRLPLDFISWHAFGDDPFLEKELTLYGKYPAQLIRDWLKFFKLDPSTPLVITEWNYDSGFNWIEERAEKSYMVSSYIPLRLKSMFEAGVDYQVYFCLEDFQNNKEGLNINRGLFSYSVDSPFSSNAKSIYNTFLFLSCLGDRFYGSFSLDEFVGVLATQKNNDIIILISNYIDPYLGRNYIFRNISRLNERERKVVVRLFKSDKLDKIIEKDMPLDGIFVTDKLKNIFKKAIQLQNKTRFFKDKKRYLRLILSNLKGSYMYQRYSINRQCSWDCAFLPIEEKIINPSKIYQENLEISPYSVELIILRKG